ncbi:MAG: type III pantothenate kinase [Mycoplasmoidaceae bacterium]
MNKILILDIGNSLIKISIINRNKIEDTYLFGTRNFDKWKFDIKNLLHRLNYKEAIIGSVAPSINEKIQLLFPENKKIYFIKNSDFAFLKSDKKIDIENVGLDILGFSYYLIENSANSIGISFGTAIFSIIIKNKKIMGVSILPSINKAFQDLTKNTELINNFKIENIRKDFGFNTNECIESGYYHIIFGTINSMINYAYDKYCIKDVFITGGNYRNINEFKFDKKFNISNKQEQIVTLGYLLLYKNFLN